MTVALTWMSTIYRTLELLETKGIVTRTTLMGSDMAYYEITPHTHRHYAVCTSCGAMIPLHTCPVVEMPKETQQSRIYCDGTSLRDCWNL